MAKSRFLVTIEIEAEQVEPVEPEDDNNPVLDGSEIKNWIENDITRDMQATFEDVGVKAIITVKSVEKMKPYEMKPYEVTFVGRNRDAIGIEHEIKATILAKEPQEAEREVRETYEVFHDLRVAEV